MDTRTTDRPEKPLYEVLEQGEPKSNGDQPMKEADPQKKPWVETWKLVERREQLCEQDELGQRRLLELAREQEALRQTVLRIQGARQVLEELLQEESGA